MVSELQGTEPRYLTTDCLLVWDDDLSEFIAFFGDKVFVLWNESSASGSKVGLETRLSCVSETSGPQQDIQEFASLFGTLPEALFRLLKNCREKVFDIGFDSGTGKHLDARLDAGTVETVHALGFSINIRIYAVFEDQKES
jgi:hypothetical protein